MRQSKYRTRSTALKEVRLAFLRQESVVPNLASRCMDRILNSNVVAAVWPIPYFCTYCLKMNSTNVFSNKKNAVMTEKKRACGVRTGLKQKHLQTKQKGVALKHNTVKKQSACGERIGLKQAKTKRNEIHSQNTRSKQRLNKTHTTACGVNKHTHTHTSACGVRTGRN